MDVIYNNKYKFKRFRDKSGNLRYKTEIQCPVCKIIRLVDRCNIWKSGGNYTSKCAKCNGMINRESHPSWKGGRFKDNFGYIQIRIYNDDIFYEMAKGNGYVLEHRYLIAKNIGRTLDKTEIVHHLNGIKDDNRIENLELLSGKNGKKIHHIITLQQNRIKELENLLNKNYENTSV